MYPLIIEKLLESVNLEKNLLPFLKYSGWKQENDAKWIIMHGDNDILDHPLELVFPLDSKNRNELRIYINKAVELITALKNEPMQLTIQNIINFDRDIIYIRNTETDDNNSISLKLAVNQVTNLKRTLEFSASMERDVKPYFNYTSAVAKKTIERFHFGHTFSGSFGFSIQSPRLVEQKGFVQKKIKFPEDSVNIEDVPFERRIIERIARGLNTTKEAERQKDQRYLLNEYSSGFNSNMCTSIIGISKNKRATVEFRIIWSPKVTPGSDVANIGPIKINENGYEMLDYVAGQLKTRDPEYITLQGHVRALTASDNPLDKGSKRAIVLRAGIPYAKREVDIILELDLNDYTKANEAHIDWNLIQVSGILYKSGTGWRLLNINNFQIIENL